MILFFIFIQTSILCSSQTFFFDNYGTEQGLESSKVFSIIQAKDDHIWLGTKAGVSKFDGISFQNFTIENGLARGGVRVIYEDKDGILWFGHEGGGITRYNGKGFDSIYITDTLPELNITSITYDPKGYLWVSTFVDGVYKILNPKGDVKKIKYEHYKGNRLSDRIFSSLLTSEGTLYFVTDAGVKKYLPENNTFQTYVPKGLDTYFAISLVFEDSQKNLWFGTYNGGLYKLNNETGIFRYFDIKDGLATNWITSITEDNQGNIWTGHWDPEESGGITRIDRNGTIRVFNISNGLHDNKIWCIKADKEGNILIGTTDHGLDIFKGEQFISFTTSDGLINNQVWAIAEDDKKQLWFGTNGGISVYNTVNNTFSHYNQDNSHISNQISYIKKDKNNDFWIGTRDQGIIHYSVKENRFFIYKELNQNFLNSYIHGEVQAMDIDRNNVLWIGTIEGLYSYYIDKREIRKSLRQTDGLPSNDITALYVDSGDTLWAGTNMNGLVQITSAGIKAISAIGKLTPKCITEDRDHNLWIGTANHGVIQLHGESVIRYTIHEGLLSNLINLINVDDKNNIYIGTNRGINKIIVGKNKVYTYTKKSGFTGIETRNNATTKDHEGKLWFGTINGVMSYNPMYERKSTIEPLTHINAMLVNGESRQIKHKLRLSHTEKQITFQYSSICLTDPDAIKYKIMLEGWESEWNDIGTQNSINYSLPPGNYTFKVIARNNEGIWNSHPQTVSFVILAPVYQQGWFIVSVILLIAVIIFAYIKIREKSLLREKRVLESKVQERTLALSSANEQLALRNKDITDSIKYAKRIQFAILPPDILFADTFILFKPKDIVSGDFYWLTSHAGKEFMAAVDCTGHGVPGAFMSFIGHTSLNKLVIEHGIMEPAQILNRLNEEVASTLHQKGEEIVNDGMDIALICYDPSKEELQYAGAFNPLLILRKNDLIEVKANRFAIGRSTGKEKEFTNHRIKLEKNDIIYLFTDGYSDQFGGPEGKKFKSINFKELLISIASESIEKQREILDSSFENWKGNHDQIDDVLVMGRKFS